MRRYLLCHLYGPMQSWGGIAVGQVRGDEGYPTKSGFLGLCGAALGLKRTDEADHLALHRGTAFAVRVCKAGYPLRDYHTAQAPSSRKNARLLTRADELAEDNLNTVLSTRDYRVDAWYTVALWERGPGCDLDALVKAFRRPVYCLSLGRKSCPPAMPIRPEMVEAEDLNRALRQMAPPVLAGLDALRWSPLFQEPGDWVYAEEGGQGLEEIQTTVRGDALVSRARWSYRARPEVQGRLRKGEA